MRIAFWLYGGIGGGNFSQGTPALNNLITGMSEKYDVTVYSILPVNKNFIPNKFKIRSAANWISSSRLRIAALILLFVYDHIKRRYHLIHGIWLYPAGTIAVWLGRIFRIKTIASAHGGEAASIPSINYGNMLGGRSKEWTLWTCQKATALNFISHFQVKKMQSHGLTRSDYTVIPFGADIELFQPKQRHASSKLRILHVANLTEVKDQETLLMAFDEIRRSLDAELRIVGPDYMTGKLQDRVRQLMFGDHVVFTGPVPYKEINNYYHWADMMLHTSLYEGLPSVIVEAMACGVPVVSTGVGIVSDLGAEYFGIFPFANHQEAADQVVKIWLDESRRNEMRDKALNWAKTHDIKWTTHQFTELYQHLLK